MADNKPLTCSKVKSDRTHPVMFLHLSQFHHKSTISTGKQELSRWDIFRVFLEFQGKSLFLRFDAVLEDWFFLRPSTRCDLDFVVKCSVPSSTKAFSIGRRQSGEICHAFSTEAFTLFFQTYGRALCSDRLWRHCLFASTRRGRLLFLLLFLVTHGWLLSRRSPRSFQPSWLGSAPFRSCLQLPPWKFLHAGGWHLRRKLFLRLHPLSFWTAMCLHDFWQVFEDFRFKGSRKGLVFLRPNFHTLRESCPPTTCVLSCRQTCIRATLNVTPSHQEVLHDITVTRFSTWLHWERFPFTSWIVKRCVATCHARARWFSVSPFGCIFTSFRPRLLFDGMSLLMETILDSSLRNVPESVSWRMATGWWCIRVPGENCWDSSLRCSFGEATKGRQQRLSPQVRATFGHLIGNEILIAGSWRTWCSYMETLRNWEFLVFWGKTGGTIASPKACVQF